jgi:opacity protein-like surface antigen
MLKRSATLVLAGLIFASQAASAKGLEDLSGQNPELKAEEEPAETPVKTDTAVVNQEPVSYAGPLHQKLSFATSFGWVSASRSKGDWRGNGISDFTVGYRFLDLNAALSLAGTYRYAPINVVGEEDDHSYRGIWEAHYFGMKADYKLNPKTNLTGGMELGYVLVYLTSTDGLETEKKHEENGVSVTLGGGADFMISENWAFSAGPRLYAGFGSFTTIQVGASAGFMF